ncbi:MAG: hypothetical protein ACI83D_000424 [Planctomycetota bacterium]|jgi:hypothetical protein
MQESSSPDKRIEEVRENLYRREHTSKEVHRARMRMHESKLDRDWRRVQDGDRKKTSKSKKTRFWSHLFWFAAIFFVVSLGFAYYALEFQKNRISSDLIDITIESRAFVDGGEKIPVVVQVANRNTTPLTEVFLALEYPGRSTGVDEKEQQRIPIDDLSPGMQREEVFTLALFGEPGQEKDIRAILQYKIPGSSAIFLTDETFELTIRNTPIQVSIEAREDTVSGQEFTYDIEVQSQATDTVEDLVLEVEYPAGFAFVSSDPVSDGVSVWELGGVYPGETQLVSITGTYAGFPGEQKALKAYVGIASEDAPMKIATTVHSAVHTVFFREAFIQSEIAINGNEFDDIISVNSDDTLSVQVFWRNSSGQKIRNPEFRIALSGSVFDASEVTANKGFFDSVTNTITWNQSTDSGFEELESGDQGSFGFSFTTKPLVGSGSFVVNDPEVVIDLSLVGSGGDGTPYVLDDAVQKTVRINSGATLSSSTLYYSGPFEGEGAMPPTVGSPTSYTLLWSIRNSSNRLEGVQVRASLPIYVDWLDQISPGDEKVTFDPESREIVWDIENIEPRTGYGGAPREVALRVLLNPSSSQLNQSPVLTGPVVLSGTDIFTENLLRIHRKQHTTRLDQDTGRPGASGVVSGE